jgi:thiamine-monophosphate kinase
METEKSRIELNELGEFGLIKHLTQSIKLKNKSTVKGVGDDAAVIDHGKLQTVVTTDMLVENVHFDLTYSPIKHLGYKAVVANLSDVLAMNANPTHITISIALSNRFSLEAVEELYAGIHLACKNYNIDLIGGDTTSSVSGLVISITALGEVDKKQLVQRSTAKENDLVCVSGDLGAAYVGLQILEREKAVFKENPNMQPELSGHDYILERQLKPEARTDVIQHLQKLNVLPTSMIDISDGLASELLHLCDQSNLGCSMYEEKIPIDHTTYNTAIELNLDPTICALSGGEDYELLFTISQKDHDKIKDDSAISVIGHMSDKATGRHLISKDGQQYPLTAQGWDALLNKKAK